MKTYTVGRGSKCHIVIDRGENFGTISEYHADITQSKSGDAFLIVDRISSNGTYLGKDGAWERLRQSEVGPSDRIRLGGFVTTVRDLMASAKLLRSGSGTVRLDLSEPPREGTMVRGVKPYRDPGSGQVVE